MHNYNGTHCAASPNDLLDHIPKAQPLDLSCRPGNLGKFWSAFGQHKIQYT